MLDRESDRTGLSRIDWKLCAVTTELELFQSQWRESRLGNESTRIDKFVADHRIEDPKLLLSLILLDQNERGERGIAWRLEK